MPFFSVETAKVEHENLPTEQRIILGYHKNRTSTIETAGVLPGCLLTGF